jgi:nicotinate-nucleotide pyrophosphorylase (carboxylating)
MTIGKSEMITIPDPGHLADSLIELAFKEDLGPASEDVTTIATIPETLQAECRIECRETAVIAGMALAAEIFHRVDSSIKVKQIHKDGELVKVVGSKVATIVGPARGIMSGERIALNFLQRMSGIATITRQFVELAAPYGIAILDTRKTTPGMRIFQREAVRLGGGTNHRFGLFDAFLIKDNHIAIAGGVGKAVRAAKSARPGMRVEVEAASLPEVAEALVAQADAILLDNMAPDEIKSAIELIAGRAFIEVSGGITLDTISQYLIKGVNAISVGALTHSAPSVDFSLEVDRTF